MEERMQTKAKLTPAEIRRKVYEHQEKEKCRQKARYNDEKSAQARCEWVNAGSSKRKGGKQSYPYKCPWCPFWHLSTNSQANR